MTIEPGTLFAGKYRVVRMVGQGGMGAVFEAVHDDLDQRVAIKLMAAQATANPEWVARFSREARAAARLKSEHAVKVYDVGKTEAGVPFMVMELLEGRDLQQILEEDKKLPVTLAVEYVLQACEALAEAHAFGIVHRDLKPANLFVAHRPDGSPAVKVLDFGISKVTGDLRGISVTNTTAIVGSPLYMSPEQMKASKNVDARTDIWSLGVILQELVTGMPPFIAETAPELCALVLTAPPSRLGDTLTAPPAGFETVIAQCLEKDPAKRIGSIAALARALEPFATGGAKTSIERIIRLAARAPAPSTAAAAEVSQVVVPATTREVVSGLDETHASDPSLAPRLAAAVPTASVGATQLSPTNEAPPPVAPVAAALEAPTRAVPVGVAATNAAWGTGEPTPPRRAPIALFAGLGLLVVALLGGGILFLRARSTEAPTQATSEPKSAPVPPSATVTTSTAATPTTSIPTLSADDLPTAHTAPTTHPTVKPTTSAKPPGTTKTAPSASAPPKPSAKPALTSDFGGRK